jgi:inosine-uridine nucleoside N-ribohydrolase
MTTPIILDCDPGHDDAIALLLALASPELELLGVTTVSGNQTLEKTTANALRVLEFAGKAEEIAVAAGADRPFTRDRFVAAYVHGETGLDGPDLPPPQRDPLPQHALEFIAEHVEGSERPVTLVPTGPLTNIALFLARYPELEGRIERVVLMGGAIAEGNVTPAAEFNIWADPEAAHRVFRSGLDVTMIGLDVTHKALMTPDHAEELRAGGRHGRLVAELFEFYHRFHARQYALPGSPVHDAVALAHVFRGDIVETLHRAVVVDTGGELSRGRTYVDLWQRTDWPVNAHVGVDIDGEAFLALLLERISSLDRAEVAER